MISKKIKVRGYHCDAYGHVNNARYLEFLEEARWTYLQPAVDKNIFKDLGLLFVVVGLNINYRKSVIPGDEIEVSVDSCQYERKTIRFEQRILRGDELCAEAQVKFVLLDESTQKASPINDSLIELFNNLLEGHA